MMVNNVICKILHHEDEYLDVTLTQCVNNNTNFMGKNLLGKKYSRSRTFQNCLYKRQPNK
jgi:hypothetical protein